MLFRDLLRLLADERPRVGWWVLLVALSVTFALVELVSSFAVLALDARPASSRTRHRRSRSPDWRSSPRSGSRRTS